MSGNKYLHDSESESINQYHSQIFKLLLQWKVKFDTQGDKQKFMLQTNTTIWSIYCLHV